MPSSLSHACAVVRSVDVADARLLLADLRIVEPDLQLVLLVLPGARAGLTDEDGVRLLRLADVGLDRGVPAIMALSQTGLAHAARPLLIDRVLRDGADGVVLLPPDAQVRAPLQALREALADGDADAVLVPRLSGRLPDDGEQPGPAELDAAGLIDDELVAVGSGDGTRLVRYWAERVAPPLDGIAPGGEAHLARPLDAAPRAMDGIAVLDDPGYDVSAWNLHERELGIRDDGALTASGSRAVVVRFAGFRADRPWWLSQDASRHGVLDDPILAALCRDRAAALRGAGWAPPPHPGAAVTTVAARVLADERLSRLHGEAVEDGEAFGDLDDPASADAFVGWLRGTAPAGRLFGITRYAYDVWRSRPDVQKVYPDLDDDTDAPGFIGWLWVNGLPELKLDAALLPPAPEWVESLDAPPVEVLGYLRGALGLGEAARGYARALRAAGVQVATHTVPLDGPDDGRGTESRRRDEIAYEDETLDEPAPVVLACVNAPQLPELIEQVGAEALDGRYLIGQWGWEVDVLPPWWEAGLDLVDEIWVYSTYVADNLSKAAAVPVVAVPIPVTRPEQVADRLSVELPDAPFTFLFAFDFLSTLQRKNPVGLIEAFSAAFAPGEGPALVLKTTNARFRKQEVDRLRFLIGDRTDIVLVDASLPVDELALLFQKADCYVSLHRSEGFGLTLAESMILGKPVVATRFGGNTDFMTPANSYLVDYEPTEVGPDGEHYPAEGRWAEPSVEHAAQVLREVWEDRDGAAARGARAAADIEAQLSPEAVGAIARARLQRIAGHLGDDDGGPDADLPWPIGELDDRLRFDLGGGEGGGVRGLARRAALRAVRPYTVPARRLDETMAVSLRRLAVELDALKQARERDRERIARLERQLRGGE